MVLSTFSTVTIEEVAAATTGPLWFQLYVQPDREFTRELARRAEAAGYQALTVTIDTSVFRSTRVSAQTLLDYLDSGSSRDEFLEFFPSVRREDARDFLTLSCGAKS